MNIFENATTIPTPEELSSDCGVSLQIKTFQTENEVRKIFSDKDIKFEKMICRK